MKNKTEPNCPTWIRFLTETFKSLTAIYEIQKLLSHKLQSNQACP